MKKIGFIILCTISLLCITSCSNGNKAKEYILTDTPIDGKELVDLYKDSGECENIYINEDEDVVIWLTEKQRVKLLKSELLENPESFSFPIGDIGPSFLLQNQNTELVITGTMEEIVAFEETAKNYAFEAELQQVLSGDKKWQLKVVLMNSETNSIIHVFSLPEEELDWTILQEK